jgi:hypothetical protein
MCDMLKFLFAQFWEQAELVLTDVNIQNVSRIGQCIMFSFFVFRLFLPYLHFRHISLPPAQGLLIPSVIKSLW